MNKIQKYISDSEKEFKEKWDYSKYMRDSFEFSEEIRTLLKSCQIELIEFFTKELKKIQKWPEPQKGAGEGFGAGAGAGMYIQYDHDREKHEKQILRIIKELEK